MDFLGCHISYYYLQVVMADLGIIRTLLDHKMAERTGLEPATLGVTGRYANQLNYSSTVNHGGCRGARTPDIRLVRATLYQLS